MKYSLVIPCYNEAKNLPYLFEKFNFFIDKNIEVIIVNNGSKDNSREILEQLIKKFSFVRVCNVKDNIGYGFGITSGLKLAKGEFIGYTHADLQTDPKDVLKALQIIANDSDPKNCFVKGNRKKRPNFDKFFTVGMSIFETIYLKTRLWDINAQPNIFHRSFFEYIKSSCPKDFSFDLYLLYMAKKKSLNIIRFDVFFPDRLYGVSSWNTGLVSKWKFMQRTFKFSKKLKKSI